MWVNDMKPEERRRQPRHEIHVPATIITPEKTIPGYALDISTDGIRLNLPEPVLPNTEVALSLDLDEETLLSGTVQWTIETPLEDSPLAYQVGIKVHSLILQDMEAIGSADRDELVRKILSRVK